MGNVMFGRECIAAVFETGDGNDPGAGIGIVSLQMPFADSATDDADTDGFHCVVGSSKAKAVVDAPSRLHCREFCREV
jgi:hypothetical protein